MYRTRIGPATWRLPIFINVDRSRQGSFEFGIKVLRTQGRQARNCAGSSCVQWQKRCLCLDGSTPPTTTGLINSLLLSRIAEAVKCGPLSGESNDNTKKTTVRAVLAPFTTTATPQSNNLLLAAQRINLTPRLYVKMICDASGRA